LFEAVIDDHVGLLAAPVEHQRTLPGRDPVDGGKGDDPVDRTRRHLAGSTVRGLSLAGRSGVQPARHVHLAPALGGFRLIC
jgi:hypothetical protein